MLDRIGEKYGKLTIISFSEKRRNRVGLGCHYFWNCLCDCGNKTTATFSNLSSGHTTSCGCVVRKHDMCYTRFYSSWNSMKTRVLNKNHIHHKYYARTNVKIFDEWMSFENFYRDMYKSFLAHSLKYGEKNTTLDRINTYGDYEPSNCRWATYKVQANNRSNNRKNYRYF